MDSTRNPQKIESLSVARISSVAGFLYLGGFFVVFCRFFVEKNTNIAVKNFSVNQFSTSEFDKYNIFQIQCIYFAHLQ